jgi:SAM-dependent methyltransferase
LSFARLDLDRSLYGQGFAPQCCDIVLGVNVLHVAKDLRFSLGEIGRVLKPGGYLILAEGSPPSAAQRWRLDLVFAFLRGWWDVTTVPRFRPRPGFLLPSEWERALYSCGFRGVQVLPGESWFAGACRGGLVLAQTSTSRSDHFPTVVDDGTSS